MIAIDYGEDKEPPAAREARLARERVEAGLSRQKPAALAIPPPAGVVSSEVDTDPAPAPSALLSSDPVIGAVQGLMGRPGERVTLDFGLCSLTVVTPAISITEHAVMILLDPNLYRIVIKYESELTIVYRSQRTRVVYGGGQGQFPDWPFHILSFIVVPDDHQDGQS